MTEQTFCCFSAEYYVTVFQRYWQRFQACYFLPCSSSVSCFVMVYLDSVNVESCSAEVLLSMCYLYCYLNNIWRGPTKVTDNSWLFRFCDPTTLRAKSTKNAPNEYFTHPKLAWPVACTLLCSPECTRCRTQESLVKSCYRRKKRKRWIINLVSF